MAEEKKEMIDKLKELEQSLAKELDQRVRLTEASDPRLEGTVDVNPDMKAALDKAKEQADASAAAEKRVDEILKTQNPKPKIAAEELPGKGKDVDEISLKDVDDLLNQIDSGFQAGLKEITGEIGKIEMPTGLESIAIGADYLKEGEKTAEKTVTDLPAAPPPTSPLYDDLGAAPTMKALMHAFYQATYRLPLRWINLFRRDISILISNPRDVLVDFAHEAVEDSLGWLSLWKLLFKRLLSFKPKTYAMSAVFLILIGAIVFLVRDAYRNFSPDEAQRDPFLRNFNDVANSVQVIPEEEESEDLESPLRHPEYMVLVHRMVANLKSPDGRQTPMVVAEFYIEASNQECAIEIHNRESEVRDIIERTLEQTTFEEMDSAAGKTRLKLRIRKALNRILNRGTAKHIMFKSLNIRK